MTLRDAVLGAGIVVAVAGAIAMFAFEFPVGIFLAGWGVLLLTGILIERSHYKNLAMRAPGPGWDRTDERFIDDQTGEPVRVYIQRMTGERKYVQE